MRRGLLLAAVALMCLAGTSGAGLIEGREYYLQLGYGAYSLVYDDLDDSRREFRSQLREDGIPARFELFGRTQAWGPSAEAGWRWRRDIAFAVGFRSESNNLVSVYDDGSEAAPGNLARDAVELTVQQAVAMATYWVPGWKGALAGVAAGVGWAELTRGLQRDDAGENIDDFNVRSEDTGVGFVAGAFVGMNATFERGQMVYARVGYDLRRLGSVTPPAITGLSDVDLDFSGFYAHVGVGVTLGAWFGDGR